MGEDGEFLPEGGIHWDKVDPWVYSHAEPSVDVEQFSRASFAPDRCSYTPPPPECDKEMFAMKVVEPGVWVPPELDEALAAPKPIVLAPEEPFLPPELDPNFGLVQKTNRMRDPSIFEEYEKQNDNNNNIHALNSVFSW
jgi:hypothetical protein